jgi:hypothetical protein
MSKGVKLYRSALKGMARWIIQKQAAAIWQVDESGRFIKRRSNGMLDANLM